jgi:hypothetical protein
MSSPLRTRPSAGLIVGGALIALGGVGLMLLEHWGLGLVVAAVGLAIELSGPVLHDQAHRRRGEAPHAVWGAGDRNRPSWLPPRRDRGGTDGPGTSRRLPLR